MKKVLFVVLILMATALGQQRSQRMSGGGSGIRQRMDQVWAAWCAKDVKKAANFYAKDADAVFFDVAPLQYHGWAEYEKGVGQVLAAYKTIKMTVNSDAKIHQQGNWAWATATLTNDSTQASGKPDKTPLRWTSVWQKSGNEWLIVHEHISVPAQ